MNQKTKLIIFGVGGLLLFLVAVFGILVAQHEPAVITESQTTQPTTVPVNNGFQGKYRSVGSNGTGLDHPGNVVRAGSNKLAVFKENETKRYVYENPKQLELFFSLEHPNSDGRMVIVGPDRTRHEKQGSHQTQIEIKNGLSGRYMLEITATPQYWKRTPSTDFECDPNFPDCRMKVFGDSVISLFVGTYDIENTDDDNLPAKIDNCPFATNPDQKDSDGDGVGDVCDNCKATINPGQEDIFPLDGPEGSGNGVGDACETLPKDMDKDGFDNTVDNCPTVPNNDQRDSDGDGVGDVCGFQEYL